MQRLYSAVKSAVLTAGSGLGQVESSPHGFTSPLMTLAHVGPGEVEGGEKGGSAGTQPAQLARLHPRGGGGEVAGGVVG